MAVAILALATAPLWGPRVLRELAYFRVRRVEIVGARFIQPSDILGRLHVDTLSSVWDPAGPLEDRIASHPGVRSVRVGRRLPGTLVVEIKERWPVALVPTPSGLVPIDERGAALPIDPARTVVDAPIVAHRDTALFRLLGELRAEAPELYGRVSEVGRTGSDEVWLRISSVPVRAMADVTVERLADVGTVEQDLTRRRLRAVEIDLRYRDQVIARLQ
ncbi:MAG: cell division protein FtsQ/DivIB [Gemmatimonadaceae bacterium]